MTSGLNIFEHICEPVSNLIKRLKPEIYTKILFYYKILNKIDKTKAVGKSNSSWQEKVPIIDSKEKVKSKNLRILQRKEVKEEIISDDNLYVGFVNIGGIESLYIESIEDNCQAVLFCKKEFGKYEINMMRYLLSNIHFTRENKYIVGLTESEEPLQRLCEINGVAFKRMGNQNLFRVQQYVQDVEIMNGKILPELQHYLANYEEIKREIKEKCNGCYVFNEQNKLSNFMDYLKYFSHKDKNAK